MKLEIKKVCIIGSGVMGSAIAALFANANLDVLLLDIVVDFSNKNSLAENALKKISNKKDFYFDDHSYIKNIAIGNIDEDLERISDCDLIIEVIVEELDKKQSLYSKIEPYLSENAIIATNTSTFQMKDLCLKMDSNFKKRFFITHFFNPVRVLKLLEFVENKECNLFYLKLLKDFFSNRLGRVVVNCKDSPGFIGNRIGFFFIAIGISEAISRGIKFELIDEAMNKIFLVPKSGIFGLVDLIGLDVFDSIISSFEKNLDKSDKMLDYLGFMPKLKKMIANGCLGKKSGKGFYKRDKDELLVLQRDFETYSSLEKADINIEISNLLSKEGSEVSNCVKFIMLSTINYASSILAEISDNLEYIDVVMKEGYGWKLGLFEILDLLYDSNNYSKKSIDNYFNSEANISISEFFKKNLGKKIYAGNQCLNFYGEYVDLVFHKDLINLLKISAKSDSLILEGDSSSLLDLGDKVFCFNLKKSLINFDVIDLLDESIRLIISGEINCIALIIASEGQNFCFGADIKFFKNAVKSRSFDKIEKIIERGNEVFGRLRELNIPVVCAVSGYAVGGGCEIILSSNFTVAKNSSFIGLTESNIGLIPGWGGIKNMVAKTKKNSFDETVKNIIFGKISKSAQEAMDMHYLDEDSLIIDDNSDLISEAKKFAMLKSKDLMVVGPIKFENNIDYYNQIFSSLLEKEHLDEDKMRVAMSIKDICKNIVDFEEYQLENFLLLIKNPRTLELMENVIK